VWAGLSLFISTKNHQKGSPMKFRVLLSVALFAVALNAFLDAVDMVVVLGWNNTFGLPEGYSWPRFFQYQTFCCLGLFLCSFLLLRYRSKLIAFYRLPVGMVLTDSVGVPHLIYAVFIGYGGRLILDAFGGLFNRWLEQSPYRGDTSASNNIGVVFQIISLAFVGITMLVRPDVWYRLASGNTFTTPKDEKLDTI
jgi:hypothetical protein